MYHFLKNKLFEIKLNKQTNNMSDNFFEQPDVLSFSGGAYKTMVFLGALHQLTFSKQLDLNKVETLQGASAGAIIALGLVCGLSPSTMMYYYSSTNLMTEVRKDFQRKFFENIIFEGTFKGFTQGNAVLKKLSQILKSQVYYWQDDMTFEELYKETNQKLVITATNITKRKLIHFSHENYPKLPVLLAIRMSVGIPIAFEAYQFEEKDYVVDGDIFKIDFDEFIPIGKKILRFRNSKHDDMQRRGDNIENVMKHLMNFYREMNEAKENKESTVKTFVLECNMSSMLRFQPTTLCFLYLDGIHQTKHFNLKRNEDLNEINKNY